MRKIVYTVEALDDLRQIEDFLAHSNYSGPIKARQIVTAIISEIDKLEEYNAGHRYLLDPWYSRRVMNFSVKNKYRVFYWCDDKRSIVHVMRIIHGFRNVDKIMSESTYLLVE